MEFRLLRADEIDARISTVNENGLSLLLYKDARCDMNILDETVGSERWQRNHEVINGNLFCNVGIWFGNELGWVWKQDVGTESYTEKEKGQASDSFKRACFCWGIGRELYTAPFMWVTKDQADIKPKGNGFTCFDRFAVTEIEYTDRRISYVKVYNTRKKCFITYGKKADNGNADKKITAAKAKALRKLLEKVGVLPDKLCEQYKVETLEDMTEGMHADVIKRINALKEKKDGNKGKA